MDESKPIVSYFEEHCLDNERCRNLEVLDVDDANQNILLMASSMQRGQSVFLYDYKNGKVHSLSSTIGKNKHRNDMIASICDIRTNVINMNRNDENKENDMYESILYMPPKNMTKFEEEPVFMLF